MVADPDIKPDQIWYKRGHDEMYVVAAVANTKEDDEDPMVVFQQIGTWTTHCRHISVFRDMMEPIRK